MSTEYLLFYCLLIFAHTNQCKMFNKYHYLDKMCDQISDAILDAHLRQDPDAKVACETVTKTGMIMVSLIFRLPIPTLNQTRIFKAYANWGKLSKNNDFLALLGVQMY